MKVCAITCVVVMAIGLMGAGVVAWAQEHPGEHPGKKAEKGEQVTPDMIRAGIKDFINKDTALKGGFFLVYDDELKKTWTLEFVKVHDRVSIIKGETYFACCDFKTLAGTKDEATLDIDIWMKMAEDGFEPVDVKIHKLDGKPRYTYDKDDIVPMK